MHVAESVIGRSTMCQEDDQANGRMTVAVEGQQVVSPFFPNPDCSLLFAVLRLLVVTYSLDRRDVLGAEHQVIELETRAVSACCFVTGVSFRMCGNHRPLTFHELASGRFLQLLCVFVQAAVFSLAMNDAKAGDGESPNTGHADDRRGTGVLKQVLSLPSTDGSVISLGPESTASCRVVCFLGLSARWQTFMRHV